MNTCQTSIKTRCIIIVLLKTPHFEDYKQHEITTVSPSTELTIVGKDKRTNNNLPTCTVDQLLELSCILLVRTFHQSIHISKLQSFSLHRTRFVTTRRIFLRFSSQCTLNLKHVLQSASSLGIEGYVDMILSSYTAR